MGRTGSRYRSWGTGGPGTLVCWGDNTQPCYRDPFALWSAVSTLWLERVSLWALLLVCMVRLSVPFKLHWRLLGGREGNGKRICGLMVVKTAGFNPFSTSPGHLSPRDNWGGLPNPPSPTPFPTPPFPPKPPTSHLLSDSITTGHRDLRPHCSSPPHSTVRLAHRTLFD